MPCTPGYGFLAENAAFAAKVIDANLNWIGPAAATIAQLGDKHQARQLATEAGVAVLPALYIDAPEAATVTQQLAAFSAQHAPPYIIKAVAGGGGKGMRVVHDVQQLAAAVQATARAAATLYHNAAVLVEKFVTTPRHIEVQLVGDQQGQLAVLGERECSVQRRFQKIIEEAPAVRLSDAQRTALHAAARRLGEHVAYYSTGTVEFLLDAESGAFYFLEMNTRLQVEHTVTEEIFGVDLVAWQIKIAAGESLERSLLNPLPPQCHSIQVRIYAEDAARDFLPAPGQLLAFCPYQGSGIRWEIGCDAPSEVSSRFDPLLAKLIATAASRTDACQRLQQALARTFIAGVHTNLAFLRVVLDHADFRQARLTVNFIAQKLPQLLQTLQANAAARQEQLAQIAAQLLEHYGNEAETQQLQQIFRRRARPAAVEMLILQCQTDGKVRHGCGIYAARQFFHFVLHAQDNKTTVTVGCDGYLQQAVAADSDWETEASTDTARELRAPVPGRVAAVNVAMGDEVEAGTVCVLIESMKMEFALKATGRGCVQQVSVKSGDRVDAGALLVTFAAAP